jgi:PAS domain S-box-containing protein
VNSQTPSNDTSAKTAKAKALDLRRRLLVGAEHGAHLVQFYDEEAFLCDTVADYVAAGIGFGQPVIVIATQAHRERFVAALRERSLDPDHARATGLLTLLDADETLALFMRDGAPDPIEFEKHVGTLIRRARASREDRPARAYGEMVDLLWKAGNRQGAIRLEELWNDLAKVEQFSLVCGYSMSNFRDAHDASDFQQVCNVHSHAFPTETFSHLEHEAVRLREVAVLQQRAIALEAELAHRRELEKSLREREADLREFLDNAVEGIHLVAADGTILYANAAELNLLGYSAEEYIGHHIADFHADANVIQDILERLCGGQALTNYEARLRCRDGGIKHVLINSNVRFVDGKFVHTRCFTRDITERKGWEDRLRVAEERFRRMQEATPDGVAILRPMRDADGRITDFQYVYVNPVIAKTMGRTVEEVTGSTVLEMVPDLDETPFWPLFCQVAASGEPEIFEQPYYDNGWAGWFRGVVVSLGSEISIVYSDITARKKAQESLRFLAEASSILAASLDYDGTLTSVTKLAVPAIADWSSIDMLSDGTLKRLSVAHVDPEKVALAHELFRRFPPDLDGTSGVAKVLRTGKPELIPEVTDEILQAAVKDPELLDIIRRLGLRASLCVPLRARGRVIGAMTLVSAESQRRYTEEDLHLAEDLARRASVAIDNSMLYRSAEEANRAKDEFLAVVSHELRTPLNAISGWVHMLREGGLSAEKSRHAIETIERNARAQNQLIEDLLDVSRIVSGKLRLDVETVDLALVIERAVETVRPAAAVKNITIREMLDPKATPVFGDPDRLQQIVWNLLSNAVKFSSKDREVRVILRKLESSVEIIVKDQGAGIDPAFLPHVFERFRQADGSTTRTKGGLGLGLAIVRNLVELHGGSVRAESDGLGQGAAFCVSLPIAPIRTPSFARPPLLQLAPSAPKAHCPPELEGVHVLVVDDEQDARELVAELLSRCKLRVSTAGSAQEALRIVQAERPGVIVSDIGMPEEDGYSLIRKVRALPPSEGGNTPAIALTAYARTEERTKTLVAGFNMHVPKPVEPAELLAVLASLTAVLRS